METHDEQKASTVERAIAPSDPKAKYAVALTSAHGVPLVLSGTEKSVAARLRDAALTGEINGDITVTVQRKTSEGKWINSESTVRNLPYLGCIYRPLKSRLVKMIGIGALVGISWETLYQSWQLFQHYQSLAPVILFWLPFAFLLGIAIDEAIGGSIARFVFPGIIILIFMGKGGAMMQSIDSISEVLAPTFGALVVSAAIGATLGITAVAGVSGIWILLRRPHMRTAPDAKRESVSTYKALMLLLLVMFSVLFVTYVKWSRHWPVAVEISLREDLKAQPRR